MGYVSTQEWSSVMLRDAPDAVIFPFVSLNPHLFSYSYLL